MQRLYQTRFQKQTSRSIEGFISKESSEWLITQARYYEYRSIRAMLNYVVVMSSFAWLVLVVIPSSNIIWGWRYPISPEVPTFLCFLVFVGYGVWQLNKP